MHPRVPEQPKKGLPRQVVYAPACVTRMMGPATSDSEQGSVHEKLLSLFDKAGYEVIYPEVSLVDCMSGPCDFFPVLCNVCSPCSCSDLQWRCFLGKHWCHTAVAAWPLPEQCLSTHMPYQHSCLLGLVGLLHITIGIHQRPIVFVTPVC